MRDEADDQFNSADSGAPSPFAALGIEDPHLACVICLVDLDASNRTKEHVYPQWLQEYVGIDDKRLTLPDGRLTRYERLLVPLCATCNNADLQQLEEDMAGLFRANTISPRHVPQGVL